MDKKESLIREKRTIEATKKGFMGATGKLGRIVMTLGTPIIANTSGSLYDVRYMSDPYDDYDIHDARTANELLENMPSMYMENVHDPSEVDDGWSSKPSPETLGQHDVGWIFDGLSRGMHLEIKYVEHRKELLVTWKGYPVYKEVAGVLESYAPLPEWEGMIDRLYKVAKVKNKNDETEEKEELTKEAERIKMNWWQKIRLRWGL